MPELKQTPGELANLLYMVKSHPCATPAIVDGIDDILSQAAHLADPYESPEGIRIYIEAHQKLAKKDGHVH